jgi:malonyl-CoA/methylmalonyl-CoA synthetase
VQSLYATFRQSWRFEDPFLRTPEGLAWSYGDLDSITAELAGRTQALGLRPGDRLAAVLERSPWLICLYLACARAGLVFAPLNPRLTASELAPLLADIDPALAGGDPWHAKALAPLLPPAVPLRTLDRNSEGSLRDGRQESFQADVALSPGHPAAIVYTSGTTGRPKGAVLAHDLFVGKARALGSVLRYERQDCLLHAMPLYHAHGLFMTLHCVLNAGAGILLMPGFEASRIVETLPQATVFSGVPTMYKRMAQCAGLQSASAHMRLFVSGSAALPADVFTEFEARSGGHRIVECWGMSETMTNTANPPGDCRLASAGKPLPGVGLRITDEQGLEQPAGQHGTVEVRFGLPFSGYWRRPASEQPECREGWTVTGDLGYLDEDGYLRIVGRKGDMVISGGFNVYPREVEIALEELPEVARAAVFGVPHADLGEAVVAAVECAPGVPAQPDAILSRLRTRLVGYKLPKALFLEAELPTTELGKVQRAVLRERYRAHFDQAS